MMEIISPIPPYERCSLLRQGNVNKSEYALIIDHNYLWLILQIRWIKYELFFISKIFWMKVVSQVRIKLYFNMQLLFKTYIGRTADSPSHPPHDTSVPDCLPTDIQYHS